MYRLWIFLLIFAIFISCNKAKNIDSQETFIASINKSSEDFDIILINNDIENLEQGIHDTSFPKIMYVNSKEGLRKRSEPSISGEVTGLLLYGERIIIWEKSDTVDTIDGIIDYWYRLRLHVSRNEWIFGGYISEYLPSDLPIILGRWDNINNNREAIRFHPNYDFNHSLRTETSNVRWGNWELNGEIITVTNLKHGMDFIGIEKETEDIILEIIDNNNIVLKFSDRIVELRRSNEFW
jgi:hypothetical protein